MSGSLSPPRGNPAIKVDRLTKNVTIKHLEEIFEVYGKIIEVELPITAKRKFYLYIHIAFVSLTTYNALKQ